MTLDEDLRELILGYRPRRENDADFNGKGLNLARLDNTKVYLSY